MHRAEQTAERRKVTEMAMMMIMMMMMMVVNVSRAQPDISVTTRNVEVRISNGTKTDKYLTGLVEVMEGGRWQAVCDVVIETAVTICRMKGYTKGDSITGAVYGNGTGSMYTGYFFCDEEANDLSECTIYERSAFQPCSAIGIICFNNTEDVFQMQLAEGKTSGSQKTGRLEVRMADLGWGPVCDAFFNQVAADLACVSMGYQYGQSISVQHPASTENQTFRVSSIYCQVNKVDLLGCVHSLQAAPRCYPDDAVNLLCVNASVRLQTTHADVLNVGTVELLVKDRGWAEVCDINWDDTDAQVVCKELGYLDGKALCCNQLGSYTWGTLGIVSVFTNVSCTGDEQYLENCTMDSLGAARSCSFDGKGISQLASVICYETPLQQADKEFKARLVLDGNVVTNREWGRLQVRRNGFWGDVCPAEFTHNEATVACRMLGYNGGKVYGYRTTSYSGENNVWGTNPIFSSSPVWITQITCNGTETSLEQCDVPRWGIPTRSCRESSYIICYRTELELVLSYPGQPYGRLDMMFDDVKGTVCGDNFEDHDADVACTTLGYFGGKVLKSDIVEKGNGPVYLSDVKCSRNEQTLFHCDSQWKNASQSCLSHNNDAMVSCFKEIELRHGDHRSGLVVVYDSSGMKKGQICSHTFDDMAAQVICRQIGFKNGYALPPGVYGEQYEQIPSELVGLQCMGNETDIMHCPYSDDADLTCFPYATSYASVSCFNTKIIQNEKYRLELSNIEGIQKAGQLNVFYKQTWGYVCGTFWDDQAANVLCRQMGNMGGISYTYPGVFSGPFFITDTDCMGNESTIESCSSMDSPCYDVSAAGVLCYQSAAPNISILQEGPIAGHGRIAITVDGEEGRVCGSGWSDMEADIACQSMGYSTGIALTFPKSDKSIFMSDVECYGHEDNLFRCENNGWRRQHRKSCMGTNATEAGVMCFHNVKLTGGNVTENTISGMLSFQVSAGMWYTVCSGIGLEEANVACREMGFRNATVLKDMTYFFSSSYYLTCQGNESSLMNCSQIYRRCYRVARVFCFNESKEEGAEGGDMVLTHQATSQALLAYGFLAENSRFHFEIQFPRWQWSIESGYHGEVKARHGEVIGTICREGWTDSAANTLCRSKGFKGGIAFGTNHMLNKDPEFVWFSNVTCPADSSNMTQCSFNTSISSQCHNSEYTAAVLCYNISAPTISLVGGPNKMEGRVQIEFDGVAGTVCNNSWSRYDARILCKQLGHVDGEFRPSPMYGKGSGPVYMDQVGCLFTTSGMENFFTCPNAGWKQSQPSCLDHSRDAAVICHPIAKLDLKRSIGPVVYYHRHSYRLVCGDTFDDNAAKVVCRTNGFYVGKALYPGAFGYRRMTFAVSQVDCRGNEDNFQDCSIELGPSCKSAYATAVCSQTETANEAYSVQLENNGYGVVTINHYNHGGFICANNYGDNDAMVVCREAGFLTGFAYRTGEINRDQELHWLSDLNCTGLESRLDQCRQGNKVLQFGKYAVPKKCHQAAAFCSDNYDHVEVQWRLNGNGSMPSKGYAEVKINGTWGRVCALTMSRAEADVFCRQMGFISGDVINERFGAQSVPSWLTRLECSGNEEHLMECDISLGNQWSRCLKDAAVQCHAGVRLAESGPDLSTRYGVLEVMTSGDWTAVCSSSFNNRSANIVCKELGHAAGYYQSYEATPKEMRWFGAADILCPAGNSVDFIQCVASASSHNSSVCPQASYVFLFCLDQAQPEEDISVSLDGLTGIPVFSRYNFRGAACSHNFSNENAQVICRQHGFAGGYALGGVPSKSYSRPLIVSQLSCRGDETNINQCRRGIFVDSYSDCPDPALAHVLCTKTSAEIKFRINPKNMPVARAEVNVDGEWKLIDRYGFNDDEAKVFCRSVGFRGGVISYGRLDDLPEAKIAVGNLNCLGNENSLLQCRGNWSTVLNEMKPSYYGVTVRCQRSVRLLRGSSQADGMLQYEHNGAWGPVCAMDFDNNDADVVCHELGYDRGISLCCSPFGITFTRYTMARVQCKGDESSIKDCPHSTAFTDVSACSFYSYASVACYMNNDTRNYSLSFSGNSQYSGAIAVTYLGAEGRICSDNWDDDDAQVACREMGFQEGQAYTHYRTTGRFYNYDGPLWSSQFECTGNESSLGECPHMEFGTVTDCVSEHLAGALCYNELSIAYKLEGNITNSGIVMVRIDAVWGSICGDDWDEMDAHVFCKSEGFTSGDAIPVNNRMPMSVPVFASGLRCKGTESDLNKCIHEGWQQDSGFCRYHYGDAAAFCYTNVRLSSGPGQTVTHGAVQLYQNDTWTLVCDANFDDLTARMVCQELGYDDGRAVCCSAYSGSLTQSYSINPDVSLRCRGDEASLKDCIYPEPCRSEFYASVVCFSVSDKYNDTEFDIKLDNDDIGDSGKLVVEHMGVSGRICAVNWTDEDAEVFCKSQGFTSGLAYVHSHRTEYLDHSEIGPYFLSNFSCTGNETSLLDCPHDGRMSLGNCSSGLTAGAACYQASAIKYRLADGQSNYGRVEMALDNIWGTVCDQYWGNVDADVLCRSLNFTSGLALGDAKYGEGTGPVWLKKVHCKGTEAAIHQCPHTGFTMTLGGGGFIFYTPPCSSHADDASVICYKHVRLNSAKADAKMGALEVYHGNRWVAVCDSEFTNTEATVACKGLLRNFNYGVVIKGSAFGEIDIPLNLTAVRCVGDEEDIADCHREDTGTCSSGYYASIACSEDPFPGSEGDFQMRLASDSYSSDRVGIVEILDNGVYKRICAHGWDDEEATVVCKQLGFKGGVIYTHIIKHWGPIGFHDIQCHGNETSLDQCSMTTTPDLENCSYDDYDAGVICYASSGLHYALGGGNSSSVGRVEIHYDKQVGGVCSLHWTHNDSRVLCRSLGYSDGIPISPLDNAPASLGIYFLNAPFCQGTERTLLECLNSGFNSTFMNHVCFAEAYTSCFNYNVSITDMRLVRSDNSNQTNAGRVEIFLNGPNQWGTVCDDYWDDFDATVVCVYMGYIWGEAVVNQTYGMGKGRIWLDNVECRGSETSLDQCLHRGYGTHNCRHSEDAGVFCHNTAKPTLPPTTTTTIVTTTTKPTTTSSRPLPVPTTTTKSTTRRTTTTKKSTTVTSTKTPTTKLLTTSTTRTKLSTTSTLHTRSSATSTASLPAQSTAQTLSHKSSDETVPIAVGVTVSIILIIAIIAIVIFIVVRRKGLLKSNIPHQRFSDEIISGSADGSVAMHNQMFDSNVDDVGLDPMSNSIRNIPGEGEITLTLADDRAIYNAQNPAHTDPGISDNGFANPLYSVMQPYHSDSDQFQNGHSATGANGSVA